MIKSKWNKYVGIATTAILHNNDRILEVYCPEFMPTKHGNMSAKDTKLKVEKVTLNAPKNKKNTAEFSLANTIECEYMGSNTNVDIPDIHIGEQVWVHNYAGTEKFYWSALDRDDNIRRVEHYKVKIADEQKTNKELTDDNTYLFEMDTRNGKLIRLKTSWSDGEEYIYQFHINAKTNVVTLWDTNKQGKMNIITLDSNIPLIRAYNRDETFVELRAKDINMYAPENWNVTVDKDANFTIAGNVTSTVMGNVTSTILKNFTSTVTNNVTLMIGNAVTQTCKKWALKVAAILNISAKKASISDDDGKSLHVP